VVGGVYMLFILSKRKSGGTLLLYDGLIKVFFFLHFVLVV
jgi:hypothetical protein